MRLALISRLSRLTDQHQYALFRSRRVRALRSQNNELNKVRFLGVLVLNIYSCVYPPLEATGPAMTIGKGGSTRPTPLPRPLIGKIYSMQSDVLVNLAREKMIKAPP